MRVRVLGSAAGGSFPQWNCNCENCAGVRAGTLRAKPRTQSTIAISAGGARWCLLNASPDLGGQIASFPRLAARDTSRGISRGSSIDAVLLTDAEIDHIAGLLSLRETGPLHLYCTAAVFEWVFKSNPIFAALVQPGKFTWSPVQDRQTVRQAVPIAHVDGAETGLKYQAYPVAGKVPVYARPATCDGSNLAYRIVETATGASLFYVPVIRELDDEIIAAISGCDCVLFDGSFWSETEMESRGAGTRTASTMGHLPIGGCDGSLARLGALGAIRKIYTHINNTNPILNEDSPERHAVIAAGWQVAEDGMELEL